MVLARAAEDGYTWDNSKHRGKNVWRIRYNKRDSVGNCARGDVVKLGELVQKHRDKAAIGDSAAVRTKVSTDSLCAEWTAMLMWCIMLGGKGSKCARVATFQAATH